MHITRIKICGLTRSEDIASAIAAGADALGLVFYAPSARSVSVQRAVQLIQDLPPFVVPVGLFVDPDPSWLGEVLASVPLGLLQFHGDESAALCESAALPYIKAIRLPPAGVDATQRATAQQQLRQVMSEHQQARGFLLDTLSATAQGGTGEQFDWSLLPAENSRPLVLAGGLNADNVGAAIAAHSPYAVDVSSGVETTPGIKDVAKINAFVRAVRDAQAR